MRVTVNHEADAAYFYLVDEPGEVASTYLCDADEVGGMINLDFNSAGQLIGIEVLDASRMLPASLVAR